MKDDRSSPRVEAALFALSDAELLQRVADLQEQVKVHLEEVKARLEQRAADDRQR